MTLIPVFAAAAVTPEGWPEGLTVARLALYMAVMAGVTYLIRMIPFTAFRKQIKSRFIRSFLNYMPYAVLGAMTFPGIFYATGSVESAVAGTVVGMILAFCNRSLLTVSLGASGTALAAQLILNFLTKR